jgi:hypothetical protein
MNIKKEIEQFILLNYPEIVSVKIEKKEFDKKYLIIIKAKTKLFWYEKIINFVTNDWIKYDLYERITTDMNREELEKYNFLVIIE